LNVPIVLKLRNTKKVSLTRGLEILKRRR